ncbi:MAG: hypothetical protein AAGD07_03830, partial [Planctomycetota bacterium]
WDLDEAEAAVRFWNAAVLVQPSFAPAHLNLALAFHVALKWDRAVHQWQLANAWNVQDCYQMSRELEWLAGELIAMRPDDAPPPLGESLTAPASFKIDDYEELPSLTGQDLDMAGVYEAIAILLGTPQDAAACWNNLGVYLLHQSGKPKFAASYLSRAHLCLLNTDPSSTRERRELLKVIVSNLADAANQGELAEADFYNRLALQL